MKYDSLAEALFSRLDFTGECWEWKAGRTAAGYGEFGFAREMHYSHRASYELQHGPIPKGMTVDHLCRNRACARPLHLELVTLAENKRRGMSRNAVNARKTHCLRGHPFEDGNTIRSSKGFRECRECKRALQRAYYARERAAAAAVS